MQERARVSTAEVLLAPLLVTGSLGAPGRAQLSLPALASVEPELAMAVRVNADGSFTPLRTRWDAASATLRFDLTADGTYAVVQIKRQFPDSSIHWATDSIKVMASRLVAGGYPDGTFKPDNTVNRAEFIAFLVRALALQPASGNASAFTDIPSGAWYAGEVQTAHSLGLVSGLAAGIFGADGQITREQVAVFLGRALRASGRTLPTPSAAVLASFGDASEISDWARADMAALVELGLLRGLSEKELAPKGVATRAQTMALLSRMLDQLN